MVTGTDASKGPLIPLIEKTVVPQKAPGGARKSLVFSANNAGRHPEQLYDIEKKTLGSGAFGYVKLGHSKKTKQAVALKYVQKKSQSKAELLVLQNEIDINIALDHPNIARMYETFEDSQFIYIAMELCQGGEMFDLIIDQGCFSEAGTGLLMDQILRAVFYMHSHGIVHRDLKPENFLLTKKKVDISQNTLKVIDFGIAKRFDIREGEGKAVFKTKAGTAYYIAPEILAGRYNERVDVWSCGVIMYILLSGSPPFAGDEDADILKAVKKGAISFNIPEFRPVSKDAKDFIMQCCTVDAKKRLSAEQAVNSKWIKTPKDSAAVASNREVSDDSKQLISKFKAFSGTSRFKKAALHIIAHHVDEDDQKKLRDQFNKMDKNGDGELSLEELLAGCRETGTMASSEATTLFKTLDTDNSGSISYSEFLAASLDQKHCNTKTDVYWEAFRVFDVDGNGKITPEEFAQIMQNDGLAAFVSKLGNQKELEAMFKEADGDGDGEIDFEEFVQMMDR